MHWLTAFRTNLAIAPILPAVQTRETSEPKNSSRAWESEATYAAQVHTRSLLQGGRGRLGNGGVGNRFQ